MTNDIKGHSLFILFLANWLILTLSYFVSFAFGRVFLNVQVSDFIVSNFKTNKLILIGELKTTQLFIFTIKMKLN